MKKHCKKLVVLLLTIAMVLPNAPLMGSTSAAAEKTDSAENYTDEATGTMFVYYEDISAYRGDTYNYPQKEGYVFGGWWLNVTEASDKSATAVSSGSKTGAAWAKFVPEDVLSVKAQVSKAVSEVAENGTVTLRLVTTVDSLRYSKVGFSVSVGTGAEKILSTTDVYSEITASGDGRSWTETPQGAFSKASVYFATKKITNIPKNVFTTSEFHVTPYWVTLDGTEVNGISRNRLLVSDDLANETDGSGFTVADASYTHQAAAASDNTASYQYFKGASDTVWMKGTYTTAGSGNSFGISIRNGGETRQIFFDNYGIKVVKDQTMTAAGYADTTLTADKYNVAVTNADGIYVWVQKYTNGSEIGSVVHDMISAQAGTKTEVIWAIENNVLYCTVAGKVSLRLPMEKLCSAWQNGRYYQLGVAGYNTAAAGSAMKYELLAYKLGKTAYGTEDEPLLHKETETLVKTNMVYEPINASYLGGSTTDQFTEMSAVTEAVSTGTAVGIEATVENWGDDNSETGVGITVVRENGTIKGSRQLILFYDSYARVQQGYAWSSAYSANVHPLLTSTLPDGNGKKAKLEAAVYDDTFYVLVDGVTSYQAGMSELFGTDYNAETDKIRIGITSYEHSKGYTPSFSGVTTYTGKAAVAMKTDTWTFYPYYQNETVHNGGHTTWNVKDGSVSEGWYGGISFAGLSDTWEISGTLSHSAMSDLWAYCGFGIAEGTNIARLHGVDNTLWYDKGTGNGSVFGWNSSTMGNEYVIQTSAANSLKSKDATTTEVPFKVVIAHDTFFVWMNDQLTWMIPVSSVNNNISSGTEVRFSLHAWDNGNINGTDALYYKNLTVKKDSEVEEALIDTLAYAKDLNWKEANAQRTLTADGKVLVLNTTAKWGNGSTIASGKYSDAILLTETWEHKTAAQIASGVILKDATGNAMRVFISNGIWGLTEASGWTTKKDFSNYNSVLLGSFASAKIGTKNEIVWAYADGYLNLKMDGKLAALIPVSQLNDSWTADTSLSMGLTCYEPESNGYEELSNIKVLYGDAAKAVLKDTGKGLEQGTAVSMKYAAVANAYVPNAGYGFAGIYGAATSADVALSVDVKFEDISAVTGTGAGISVRMTDTSGNVKSIQLQHAVSSVNSQYVRILQDEKWSGNITVYGITEWFGAKGTLSITAIVQNNMLRVKYNGNEQVTVDLSEYGYSEGCMVQLGVASWDAARGIPYFKNLSIVTGNDAISAYGDTLGNVTSAWEVTGTVTNSEETSFGYTIIGEDASGNAKTLTVYAEEEGFCAGGVAYSDSPYVVIRSDAYKSFFSDKASTLDFRLRLVEDQLAVWFDDVLTWDIPLTEELFGNFAKGGTYAISLAAKESLTTKVFTDCMVKKGTEVQSLVDFDKASSTTASVNEMTGTMIRTGDNVENLYINEVSDTWEITGIMERGTDSIGLIPHGFIVKDVVTGKTMRFQGVNGSLVVLNTWNLLSDSRYVYNGGAIGHFKDKATAMSVYYRVVVKEDVFYFYVDGLLTWRIPLTATAFGGFEAGSLYQIGLSVNGGTTADLNDDGTMTYKYTTVRTGEEADTTGTTRFLATTDGIDTWDNVKDSQAVIDTAAGTVRIDNASDPNRLSRVWFRTEELNDDNRSASWELTGTLQSSGQREFFVQGTKNGVLTAKPQTFTACGGGGLSLNMLWKNPNTTEGWYMTGWRDNVVMNTTGYQKLLAGKEVTFKIVILEDTLYAYFDGDLTWQLDLTSDDFGGFDEGCTYALGIGIGGNDSYTGAQWKDLKVKSGNGVFTLDSFFLRDPFVLADDGVYYMYGTKYSTGYFTVLSSTDMVTWEKHAPCFSVSDPECVGEDRFWGRADQPWAPEVYKYTYKGETAYYMFATFLGTETVGSNPGVRGTAIFKADTPLGPFREWSDGAVTKAGHDCLDGTLYMENGVPYMIYCHEYTCDSDTCKDDMGSMVYVQLSEDLKTTVGEHKEFFEAKEYTNYNWYDTTINKKTNSKVTDGPFVYTTGEGQKYLLWSTFKDDEYIQIATPFTALDDIDVTNDTILLYGEGTVGNSGGHGMIFEDFDGRDILVLHTPNSGCRAAFFGVTYANGTLKADTME